MSSPTRRQSQALEVPKIDWLDLLITTVGGISTILSAASIPWISAPAEIVLKLLTRLKTTLKNADDLKTLVTSIVDFVVLLREATVGHTVQSSSSVASVRDDAFKQLCIDFTDTLTTMLNDLNTKAKCDKKSWAMRYLRSNTVADNIVQYKERLGQISQQVTLRASVETRFCIPGIEEKLSRLDQRIGSTDVFYRGQFKVIRRGDLYIRQQTEPEPCSNDVIAKRTSRDSSTPIRTKRQRRHERFFGEQPVQHSVKFVDWIVYVCGQKRDRMARKYEGPGSKAMFDNDLDFYGNATHPNIAQVFAVLPDIQTIVFHDDTTCKLLQYLESLPSDTDRLIAEYRMRVDINSLEGYCIRNSYQCSQSYFDFPVSCSNGHILASRQVFYPSSMGCGRFLADGVFTHDTLPSSNFEIPLSSGRISLSSESRSSLPSKFYDCMAAVRYGFPSLEKCGYFPLTDEYYETGFTGCGSIRGIKKHSDGIFFKKVTQVPLRLGPKIKEGRQRFRWKLWSGGEKLSRLKGYNRLEVSSPHDLNLTAMPNQGFSPRHDILLSQIHRLASLTNISTSDLHFVDQVNFWLSFQPQRKIDRALDSLGLADAFMSQNEDRSKTKVYVFVGDVTVDVSNGGAPMLTVPGIYWSSDPTGRTRWSAEELEQYLDAWDLKTSDLTIEPWMELSYWSPSHLRALRQMHESCGFDPDSDEMAKAMGFPILELNPYYKPSIIEVNDSQSMVSVEDEDGDETKSDVATSNSSAPVSDSSGKDSEAKSANVVCGEDVKNEAINSALRVNVQVNSPDVTASDPKSLDVLVDVDENASRESDTNILRQSRITIIEESGSDPEVQATLKILALDGSDVTSLSNLNGENVESQAGHAEVSEIVSTPADFTYKDPVTTSQMPTTMTEQLVPNRTHTQYKQLCMAILVGLAIGIFIPWAYNSSLLVKPKIRVEF